MSFLPVTTGFLSHTLFNMEGILLVNKPKGPTSFHIIKLLRKITGVRKIGHAGTLDPDAMGLLLVAFGRATKTIGFLQEQKKKYVARILLGISTDTDDISGNVILEKDVSPVPVDTMKKVIETFKGRTKQIPPKFSAVKYKGKRAYFLARKGEDFILKERTVTITKIDIIYYSHPFLKILVECSKGTYIRAIARDLGEKLGSCATLFSLLRTGIGKWTLREALTIKDIMDRDLVERNILPVLEIIKDLSQIDLSDSEINRFCSVR